MCVCADMSGLGNIPVQGQHVPVKAPPRKNPRDDNQELTLSESTVVLSM